MGALTVVVNWPPSSCGFLLGRFRDAPWVPSPENSPGMWGLLSLCTLRSLQRERVRVGRSAGCPHVPRAHSLGRSRTARMEGLWTGAS